MPDSPPYSDPDHDDGAAVDPRDGSTTGAPRWVKVFGIIAVILVVLVGVMLLVGGGHGPGRHTTSSGLASQASPSRVTEPSGVTGHTAPADGHTP